MTLEYARLDLLREIKMPNGAEAHTLVVMRPTAKQFAEMVIGDTVLERFDNSRLRQRDCDQELGRHRGRV